MIISVRISIICYCIYWFSWRITNQNYLIDFFKSNSYIIYYLIYFNIIIITLCDAILLMLKVSKLQSNFYRIRNISASISINCGHKRLKLFLFGFPSRTLQYFIICRIIISVYCKFYLKRFWINSLLDQYCGNSCKNQMKVGFNFKQQLIHRRSCVN